MTAAPVLLEHPSSLEHDTGSHPEQPARIVAIDAELEQRDWLGWKRLSSPAVQRAVLAAVHPEPYIDSIERAAAVGAMHMDPDTVVSSGSFNAALHACGGAVEMVRLLTGGSASCGFSIHRPPGHHAETARAMGFCLFNNIAVAAQFAIDRCGLERVLILDWDVHHGNGTNDIFGGDPRVLFISIHQSPLYPGTGPAGDVGSGDGVGYTVNLPVAPGSGDEVFCSLVEFVAAPLALAFEPQLVLVSAGFDAHRDDPLADCLVTTPGFGSMAAAVRELCADELGVPFGAVLEGGYALGPLARSVAATLDAFAGRGVVRETVPVTRESIAARERLAERWPILAS
jgi:acetoin utilization deacetylase AcuC-like enzyme